MATTGQQIVTDALFACGAYGQGDNLSDADAQLCLRRLNRMMDSWANARNSIYQIYIDTFPTVAGTASYSSSLLSNGRPVSVDYVYATLSGIDYSVDIINNQQYAAIPLKTVQSIPSQVYIDTGYPNINFLFYPVPNAVYTVSVSCWKLLQDTITMATTIAMPVGYEKAMVDGLAVDICKSMTGKDPTPFMVEQARDALGVIKRNNNIPLIMDSGMEYTGDISNSFIYKGF